MSAMSQEFVNTDFAAEFARFAAELKYEDIPAPVMEAARLNVFDTLACSIAGFRAPGVQEVLGLIEEWGGKEQSSTLWSPLRVPAPHAAWINGIMAHACDYDDTHDKAILHAGISVIPAAMAAVEMAGRPVNGKEFYTAVVLGLELMCRIGMATRIGLIQAGFIYSGLFAHFGAAAAASRILRFSASETLHALGIAYTQAAGTHQVTRDGALTKRMQPGFGARSGVLAAMMARKGITGAQRIFEGVDGLGRTYLQSELDGGLLRRGLGEQWHMEDLAYKPYPCCRMNHCAIDAALQMRALPGFRWQDVTRIQVFTNHQGNQAVGQHKDADTVVKAQFSIRYNIACALINGEVGLKDFTQEAFEREAIRELAAKVEPFVDAEMDRDAGRGVTPARLEITVGGELLTASVTEAKGSRDLPMSPQDLRRKLEDCLVFGGFEASRAGAFEESIGRFSSSIDVAAEISRLIAGVRGE